MPSINGFEVDIIDSRSADYSAEIPDDPVEDGTNLTDNLVLKPLMITVSGMVSDTPVFPTSSGSSGAPPSDDALAALLATYFANEPVTIIARDADTARKITAQIYTSMALQSLSIPRDENTGAALQFKATFKQITIVQNTRTTVPVATPSAQKKQNLGNKAAAPADVAKFMAQIDKINDSPYKFSKDALDDRGQRADGLGLRPFKGESGGDAEERAKRVGR